MSQLFFYLDASALAKRYAPEIGSAVVDHLFARTTSDRYYVLSVGMAEVASLLVRKRNGKHITSAAFAQALINFSTEVVTHASVYKIAVEVQLVGAALPLIINHSINATDGVLLRSALHLATELRARGDDLVLVASDHRLLRAAQAEGLLVFDPEQQTTFDLDALL